MKSWLWIEQRETKMVEENRIFVLRWWKETGLFTSNNSYGTNSCKKFGHGLQIIKWWLSKRPSVSNSSWGTRQKSFLVRETNKQQDCSAATSSRSISWNSAWVNCISWEAGYTSGQIDCMSTNIHRQFNRKQKANKWTVSTTISGLWFWNHYSLPGL